MNRVAAIDCGTNSIRLLIAEIDPATGRLRDLDRRLSIVRLGQGVDKTGMLAPEALDRTFAALREYVKLIEDSGAPRVRMVATSASRDAANAAEFTAGVRAILGVDPEVISGQDEAELSFVGATRELAGAGLAPPYLVVDIGGGSTEFVLGGRAVQASCSVDIGCVRMTERHLRADPPTESQVAAATADIEAAIDRVAAIVPFGRECTLLGLAGTVTTIGAIYLDLPEYDAARIHHSRIPARAVHDITARLLAAPRAERAAMPVMHPGRVDVIGGGALILDRIIARLGVPELVVSEHDILDGIAWSVAGA